MLPERTKGQLLAPNKKPESSFMHIGPWPQRLVTQSRREGREQEEACWITAPLLRHVPRHPSRPPVCAPSVGLGREPRRLRSKGPLELRVAIKMRSRCHCKRGTRAERNRAAENDTRPGRRRRKNPNNKASTEEELWPGHPGRRGGPRCTPIPGLLRPAEGAVALNPGRWEQLAFPAPSRQPSRHWPP